MKTGGNRKGEEVKEDEMGLWSEVEGEKFLSSLDRSEDGSEDRDIGLPDKAFG